MRTHQRDRYLRWLAAQPLFADVPRHLIPVVGRHVDVLDLGTGTSITTTPSREVIIIIEGFAVVHDPDQDAYAVVGPDSPVRPAVPERRARLTAITPLRCLVIARRELGALWAMAPGLVDATSSPAPVAAPASRASSSSPAPVHLQVASASTGTAAARDLRPW